MAVERENSVLARKIAAHARLPSVGAAVASDVGRAFTKALRRSAAPFEGLGLSVTSAAFTAAQDLDTVSDSLPGEGLLAALEDEAGRRGLVAVSHGLIDALIEVQTTGRVEERALPARPVTKIDEAMCRDFLDLLFGAFAREAEALPGRDWPLRMAYGSRVADRRQIGLLLSEGTYHLTTATVGFDGVDRTAELVLILPTDRTLALAARSAAQEAGPSEDETAAWAKTRDDLLLGLPVPLEAVLMRHVRPLAEVEALTEGDLIPFDASALAHLTLEDSNGHVVAEARLGQLAGRRAVRMPGPPVEDAPPTPAQEPTAFAQATGLPPAEPAASLHHAPRPTDAHSEEVSLGQLAPL